MSTIDWIVLISTLAFIVIYGVWKTRRADKNIEGYLKGNNTERWWMMGLSIMATQASAITFLSTPGQAYEDGMRFIQFYLGLPLAMIIIAATIIPNFYRLKVYTAYEYLESRFDLKCRLLAAFLFLVQRGLSTGITIYAPSIIFSTILGWNLQMTILVMGVLVTVYTVSGGTRAVSVTHQQQMAIMLCGMVLAGLTVMYLLPKHISFGQAIEVAGKMGKLNLIDFKLNWDDRYNFWSGMLGGLFVALSYFGADQSQVGRYLSGESIAQSRLSVLFNGLLKIPMQFLILFIGVLVFLFYQFHQPPVFFNQVELNKISASSQAPALKQLQADYATNFQQKQTQVNQLVSALKTDDQAQITATQQALATTEANGKAIRQQVNGLLQQVDPKGETRDTDYVFITFIITYLPHGLIGLLIAVIFSAGMSSTAAGLNSLGSTTVIDFYKRTIRPEASSEHYVFMSKIFTAVWAVTGVLFATLASQLENLIQAVNLLGSYFYGPILGIFIAAFYVKYIKSHAVFWGALLAEAGVVWISISTKMAYLWWNPIGCGLVLVFGILIQFFLNQQPPRAIKI
ncbi:sodium:solute symporter family transporter [Adhaeribacter pallidiroseus]|uniref:Sodium/iodide cotransporter n=1 Tax=Adhaeribacter pallidiroseus TaxID=2072847 RepID=A0A369QIE9_9BACT|nr:sodium:solute symporter [Adhaeribacter pallidiroseus]RDC64494.1 Sodium/iodide cotransporter [Adhaeribacter pallidiroseus]